MTTFLVEIDRFGFQSEQSGKLLIDIVFSGSSARLTRLIFQSSYRNNFTYKVVFTTRLKTSLFAI